MNSGLFLIAFLHLSSGEKFLKFYKSDCTPNSKYLANFTCDLKIKSRSLITANAEGDVLVTLRDVYINVGLYKFYNQFRPFLFNETALLCDIVDGSFSTQKGISYFTKSIVRVG